MVELPCRQGERSQPQRVAVATMANPKRMKKKEKRARFQALTQRPGIRTGRELNKEHEQPSFAFAAETERKQTDPPPWM
jgi:hypothetical protein